MQIHKEQLGFKMVPHSPQVVQVTSDELPMVHDSVLGAAVPLAKMQDREQA